MMYCTLKPSFTLRKTRAMMELNIDIFKGKKSRCTCSALGVDRIEIFISNFQTLTLWQNNIAQGPFTYSIHRLMGIWRLQFKVTQFLWICIWSNVVTKRDMIQKLQESIISPFSRSKYTWYMKIRWFTGTTVRSCSCNIALGQRIARFIISLFLIRSRVLIAVRSCRWQSVEE